MSTPDVDVYTDGLWINDADQEGGYVVSASVFDDGSIGISIGLVAGPTDPSDGNSLQTHTVPTVGRSNKAHPDVLSCKWMPGMASPFVETTPGKAVIARFTRFRHDGRLHPAVVRWIEQTDAYATMQRQTEAPRARREPIEFTDTDSDDDIVLAELKAITISCDTTAFSRRNRQRPSFL